MLFMQHIAFFKLSRLFVNVIPAILLFLLTLTGPALVDRISLFGVSDRIRL